MPEISRFFGIVIAIYYKGTVYRTFHRKVLRQTGVFSIVELKLIEGRLPKRVVAAVLEWAFEHRVSCWRIGSVPSQEPRSQSAFGVGGNPCIS